VIYISNEQRSVIERILVEQGLQGHVFAFGSRTRGDHRKYSDLDLLVRLDKALSPIEFEKLQSAFKDSSLPFEVDIVDWFSISNDFQSRIQSELIPF
jgi:type I restriction enzyme S subunit